MSQSIALHVVVRNLHDEFRTERFPGKIFALTPAALPSRHSTGSSLFGSFLPLFPWMSRKRILTIRLQKFCKLLTFLNAETCAYTNVLQGACIIKQPEQ